MAEDSVERRGIGESDALVEDVAVLAAKALERMKEEKVQAIPENYAIYFAKCLLNENPEFQDKISRIKIPQSASIPAKNQALMEKEVRAGFGGIKNMLQIITLVYKNLVVMDRMVNKHLDEANKSANVFEVQNCISSFKSDLTKLGELMGRHIVALKTNYDEVGRTFKNIAEQSIYEAKYGIFNKKYLLTVLEDEIGNVAKYGYQTSVVLVRASRESMENVASIKDRQDILSSLATALSHTCRRSDFVAYFGRECFAVLMLHTSRENACKAVLRIAAALYQLKFENYPELELKLEFAVGQLEADKSAEETLSNALDNFDEITKDGERHHHDENENSPWPSAKEGEDVGADMDTDVGDLGTGVGEAR